MCRVSVRYIDVVKKGLVRQPEREHKCSVLMPRLMDFMASRGPGLLGLCATDVAGCAAVVNAASERLLYAKEVGDSGWIGTWSEMQFQISQEDPFITTPFNVARIQSLNLCTYPIPLENEFFSYMRFGFGRWPKSTCTANTCAPLTAYDRGKFPTFSDIIPPDKKVRVVLTDAGDVGKRVLLQSLDGNDQPRYSLDGTIQVTGDFLELVAPFVDSPAIVNKVTGIMKDVTLGPVSFYELDTIAATQRLILTMQPGETTASYRRYYVGGLPKNCCDLPDSTADEVQLTALCQLAFVPVAVTTDWLVVPSVEALIHEAQAMRYDGVDEPSAKQMALLHHRSAIRLLQGQSIHEQGALSPAVEFSPFGSAKLSRSRIGSLI
jgi:hypothetical protein